MKKTTKDLSLHQFIYVFFLNSMIYNIIFIPSRTIQITGRDLWITMILFHLLNAVHLVVFYICEKINPNLTLDQIIQKSLGKAATKVVFVFMTAYTYIRLVVMLSDYTLYTTDVIFSPIWIPVVIPVILVSVYCVFKGLRSIARMTELLGPGLVFIMILTMFAIAFTSNIGNIFPVLEKGFKPVLKAFSQYQLFAADYLCLFCVIGRVKVEKNFGINISIPLIASAFFTIIFAVAYYGFYEDISVFQKQGHSLLDMSQHLLGSENLARFDFALSIIWMIAILLRIIIYTWIFYQYINVLFGLSKKPVHKYIALSIVSISLYLGFSFFINNLSMVINILFTTILKNIFIIPLQLLLPISLPFLTYMASKKEKKIQKNNMLFKKPAEDLKE